MAENYTHRRNARHAMAAAGYTPKNEKAFIYGANGPDMMFFYQMYNPFRKKNLRELGVLMHTEKTGLFLRNLFSLAGTNVQKDFCLGFLCHYALDAQIHPYVCYITNAYGSPYRIPAGHGYLESAIDSKLNLEDTGEICPHYDSYIPDMADFELNQISYLVKNALRRTYPEYADITQEEINQALRDFRLIKWFFYSPKKRKFPIAKVIEKILGYNEGFVMCHMQPCVRDIPEFPLWENPGTGLYSVETLDDILARADARAAELVKTGIDYFNGLLTDDEFSREIGSASYDTGLTIE